MDPDDATEEILGVQEPDEEDTEEILGVDPDGGAEEILGVQEPGEWMLIQCPYRPV